MDYFESHDRAQARKEARYPECSFCGQRIYEDFYKIGLDIFCEDCVKAEFRQSLDTYLEALNDN